MLPRRTVSKASGGRTVLKYSKKSSLWDHMMHIQKEHAQLIPYKPHNLFVQVTSVANKLKNFNNVGECLVEMLVCNVSFSPLSFA